MKSAVFALICLLGSTAVAQDGFARGRNRTGYHGQYRTAPDGLLYSNLSNPAKLNPYTGYLGTRITPTPTYQPRPSYFTPGYQAPQRGVVPIRYGRW